MDLEKSRTTKDLLLSPGCGSITIRAFFFFGLFALFFLNVIEALPARQPSVVCLC